MKTFAKTLFAAAALALTLPAFAQDKVKVQWYGQAAFKITTPGGKVIVIDPWITSNPRTPEALKKLESLGKVDLVLATHGHFDHMADVPALVKMHNAPFWGPAGLAQSMAMFGILPGELSNRMNKGGTIQPFGPGGVKITMTYAEHSSELVWKDAAGKDQMYIGGEACGFIIELENGFKIWHLGDTGLYGDMKFLGERHRVDLLLTPIGGGQFVMNPEDAAYATRELIKPKAVIPMHYASNRYLVGTPEQFGKAMGTGSSTRVLQVKEGETVEF
jgi:L-ascorbate metabolism protein UlaG (beta-lactamase superfamily)